jgi:hypothetical protein
MENKKSFTCDFEECGKYLDSPVTLPCGYTICMSHIKNVSYFECSMCQTKHNSFDQNGFRINVKLADIIYSNLHLDGKHKETKELYDKLQSKVSDFRKSNIFDPDTFIYDYFANLRNKIDLHRDQMIEEINNKSEQIFKELKDLENEMKLNRNKLETINLSDFIQENSRDNLRVPDLNSDKLLSIQNDLIIKISEFENKLSSFDIELKMSREIDFSKSDDKSFGCIQIIPIKKLDCYDLEAFKKISLNQTETNDSNQNTSDLDNTA